MRRHRSFGSIALFVLTAGLLGSTVALFLVSLVGALSHGPLPPPRIVHSSIFEPTIALFIEVEATAYCPCHQCTGKTEPWLERTTSLMDPAMVCDGIAADYLRALPARARVRIPGVGIREVDDTGRAMREANGTLIDVRMGSHDAANQFGRQKLIIELLL
jgi:3D (Asp-Asp-Asp) domain-containing protein